MNKYDMLSKYNYDKFQLDWFNALMTNNIDVIKQMIPFVKDINDISGGKPAIVIAARYNIDIEVLKLLIKHGADINLTDAHKNNALHHSVYRGFNEIVDVLIKSGADINIVNNTGNTPISLAFFKGRDICVKYLLQAGANVMIKDNDGRDALDYNVEFKESIEYIGLMILKENPSHYAYLLGRNEGYIGQMVKEFYPYLADSEELGLI